MNASVLPTEQSKPAARDNALVQRILARTREDGDCLIWTGERDASRPRLCIDGVTVAVRRVLYAEFVGPLSDDSRVQVACKQQCCVAPNHMRIVPPGAKRERDRAERRALRLAQPAKPPKPIKKPRVKKPVAEKPVAPVRVSFVFDGRASVNVFTAVLGARS